MDVVVLMANFALRARVDRFLVEKPHKAFLACAALSIAVLLLVTAAFMALDGDSGYRQRCEQSGHHIVDRADLCVSDDGRVIEP